LEARVSKHWDFFLSYASSDRQVAQQLYEELHPRFQVFFDIESLPLGLPFDRELIDALNHSATTVVFVSSASAHAMYQREEVVRAIALMRRTNGHHRVVPVYVDGAQPSADEVSILGAPLLQGVAMQPGGIKAVAVRLAALAGERGNGDSRGVADWPAAPGRAHPLFAFPEGGRVGAERVRRALIEAAARSYTGAAASLLVSEANALRIEAEPDDPDASVIRMVNLPDASVVAPMQYWIAVFTEARLQGPRMLAALLLSISARSWSAEERQMRDALLAYLKNVH
jgi:hypothetical protein